MARRAGRRGGIIKLYPPLLASQQPPANHQPHFMKGGRGGKGRERKEKRRGKREKQGGQRKGMGGKRRGDRVKGKRKREMRGDGECAMERGRLVEEGREGGNKGKQVSGFKAEKEG